MDAYGSVTYAEVIYQDGGALKRTYLIRNPDGAMGPATTDTAP
jgi:hypothetical protein